jgi:hypothetical protein
MKKIIISKEFIEYAIKNSNLGYEKLKVIFYNTYKMDISISSFVSKLKEGGFINSYKPERNQFKFKRSNYTLQR